MRAKSDLHKVTRLVVAALIAGIMPMLWAEDPIPSKLDSSEARDYIGKWAVTMKMQDREINMGLNVTDMEGKVAAMIDSPQAPEPLAVEDVSLDERGHLILKYPMKFGQQEFKITVTAEPSAEGLEGTFVEDSGLFKADFTAKADTAAAANGDQRSQGRTRRAAANSAKLRFGDEKVNINFHPLPADSEDHKRLEQLKEGEVFEFVGGRATKLMTDVNMKFAQAVVKKENAAPNYPGVYSVWLKKTADGWDLVFNNEADIWGTMHNAEADAVEVKVEASKAAAPAETFKVELEQTATGGIVRILWGDMQWTAPFEAEGVTAKAAPPATAAAAPAKTDGV